MKNVDHSPNFCCRLRVRRRRLPRHVVFVLPGLGIGGTERVVTALASSLATRNWKVSVISFARSQDAIYFPVHAQVSVHKLGLLSRSSSLPIAIWLLARRVIKLRYTIYKVQPGVIVSFLTRTNILTLLATFGSKIPVIVSERSNPERQPLGPIWQWLRRFLYPSAFCVVTMAPGALNYLRRSMGIRGCIIPNSISLPSNWKSQRGGKTIAAAGRLVPVKGFDLLLEAFSKISARHPEWTLFVWGDGEERARLEQRRDALGLNKHVRFPGVTTTPVAWIETADIFVLSSHYEGFPNVLAEAMAAGVPVISFDCEWGPRELIENGVNGILVPAGDTMGLARALEELILDSDLRDRLGTAAQASMRRFAPEAVVPVWENLLRKAIQTSQVSGCFVVECALYISSYAILKATP